MSKLKIETNHPEHYLLVNLHDHTMWRAQDGRWVRADPTPVAWMYYDPATKSDIASLKRLLLPLERPLFSHPRNGQ